MGAATGPNTSEERDLWGGAVAPGAPLQRGETSARRARGARGATPIRIRNPYPYLYLYPYPYPFLSLVLSFLNVRIKYLS